MVFLRKWAGIAVILAVAGTTWALRAEEITRAEFDALKAEVEQSRKEKAAAAPTHSAVDRVLENKYGPNADVTTKTGKLTISGLLQAWYYTEETQSKGLFLNPNLTVPIKKDNLAGADNNSFRIRRTELKFQMDVTENVTSVVMIDAARELQSYPGSPDNLATSGVFVRGANPNLANDIAGTGGAPRMLQDAYINYHDVIPHHDFQIGQFKPMIGEEGVRSSGQLDFVERSMQGQILDARDEGAQVHGTWMDNRLQYWVGAFNAAGNYYGSDGQAQNRSDDNYQKDIDWQIMAVPLKSKEFGTATVGVSNSFGVHGKDGAELSTVAEANPGINHRKTWGERWDGYLSYMGGGPLKGLWVRGEYLWIRDRNTQSSLMDLAAATAATQPQTAPRPFTSYGGYAAVGYKFSDSAWSDCLPSCLRPFELVGRFDMFQNVEVANPGNPAGTEVFETKVYTGGFNYYLKGHNAKIQANYNKVINPNKQYFNSVDNDSFMLNFQVAF